MCWTSLLQTPVGRLFSSGSGGGGGDDEEEEEQLSKNIVSLLWLLLLQLLMLLLLLLLLLLHLPTVWAAVVVAMSWFRVAAATLDTALVSAAFKLTPTTLRPLMPAALNCCGQVHVLAGAATPRFNRLSDRRTFAVHVRFWSSL